MSTTRKKNLDKKMSFAGIPSKGDTILIQTITYSNFKLIQNRHSAMQIIQKYIYMVDMKELQ